MDHFTCSSPENDKVIREIHHRVKNNLQTVASLLRLQMRRTASPEARRVLAEGINRVLSIAILHDLLAHSGDDMVDVRSLVESLLAENLKQLLPGQTIVSSLDACDISIPSHMATSVALVVNELLHNAFTHAFPGLIRGELKVGVTCIDDELKISVADNGRGLPQGFSLAANAGLGLQLAASIARDNLYGSISLSGCHGSVATLSFPLHAQQPALLDNN